MKCQEIAYKKAFLLIRLVLLDSLDYADNIYINDAIIRWTIQLIEYIWDDFSGVINLTVKQ